jgi:hypothetical protein
MRHRLRDNSFVKQKKKRERKKWAEEALSATQPPTINNQSQQPTHLSTLSAFLTVSSS